MYAVGKNQAIEWNGKILSIGKGNNSKKPMSVKFSNSGYNQLDLEGFLENAFSVNVYDASTVLTRGDWNKEAGSSQKTAKKPYEFRLLLELPHRFRSIICQQMLTLYDRVNKWYKGYEGLRDLSDKSQSDAMATMSEILNTMNDKNNFSDIRNHIELTMTPSCYGFFKSKEYLYFKEMYKGIGSGQYRDPQQSICAKSWFHPSFNKTQFVKAASEETFLETTDHNIHISGDYMTVTYTSHVNIVVKYGVIQYISVSGTGKDKVTDLSFDDYSVLESFDAIDKLNENHGLAGTNNKPYSIRYTTSMMAVYKLGINSDDNVTADLVYGDPIGFANEGVHPIQPNGTNYLTNGYDINANYNRKAIPGSIIKDSKESVHVTTQDYTEFPNNDTFIKSYFEFPLGAYSRTASAMHIDGEGLSTDKYLVLTSCDGVRSNLYVAIYNFDFPSALEYPNMLPNKGLVYEINIDLTSSNFGRFIKGKYGSSVRAIVNSLDVTIYNNNIFIALSIDPCGISGYNECAIFKCPWNGIEVLSNWEVKELGKRYFVGLQGVQNGRMT